MPNDFSGKQDLVREGTFVPVEGIVVNDEWTPLALYLVTGECNLDFALGESVGIHSLVKLSHADHPGTLSIFSTVEEGSFCSFFLTGVPMAARP